MKAVRIIPVLLLFAVVSAAYVWLRSSPETPFVSEPVVMSGEQPADVPLAGPATNDVKEPVQPVEERGDAMLFEIEALQNMPFDEAIVTPFD